MEHKTRMFVMTHKQFPHPEMEGFYPLQVGSALHEDLGYLRDDSGDNISDLNPFFSELTGQYWLWKNEKFDGNIGCCHYRRYFINQQKELMTVSEIEEKLDEVDILAARMENPKTWKELYGGAHNLNDLYAMGDVLAEREPQAKAIFDELLDSYTICFGNMYAMPKRIYDEYMDWLFDILERTGERIDISGYDTYEQRVYGLLSENLIQIFARTREYSMAPGKVAIIAEKSETTELKKALTELVKEDRIKEAADLYDKFCNYRKDVLFSQSDVSRELPAMGRLLHIMEIELESGERKYYGTSNDLRELLKRYRDEAG